METHPAAGRGCAQPVVTRTFRPAPSFHSAVVCLVVPPAGCMSFLVCDSSHNVWIFEPPFRVGFGGALCRKTMSLKEKKSNLQEFKTQETN